MAVIARSLPDDRRLSRVVGAISDRLDEAVSAGPDPGDGFSTMAING